MPPDQALQPGGAERCDIGESGNAQTLIIMGVDVIEHPVEATAVAGDRRDGQRARQRLDRIVARQVAEDRDQADQPFGRWSPEQRFDQRAGPGGNAGGKFEPGFGPHEQLRDGLQLAEHATEGRRPIRVKPHYQRNVRQARIELVATAPGVGQVGTDQH